LGVDLLILVQHNARTLNLARPSPLNAWGSSEESVSYMLFLMNSKVPFLCEPFHASGALELLDPLVLVHVDQQPLLLRVGLRAHSALVRSVLAVVQHVGVEMTFREEGLHAIWFFTLEGTVVSLEV